MGATQQIMLAYGAGTSSPLDAPVITGWGEGVGGSDLGVFYVEAINLAWNDITGASSYDIYRAIASSSIGSLGPYALLVSQADLTYRDTAVDWAAGRGYGYKVLATNGVDDSAFSNALRFDALSPPPALFSYYLRPGGGVNYYLRPDGVSRYIRP
jgi:hypothetical protein